MLACKGVGRSWPAYLEVEMDWQTAANIGNAVTPVIALGAVFYAAYQVRELKRQRLIPLTQVRLYVVS